MTSPTAAGHRARLLVCLATVYLVWSSSYLVTKIGVGVLPPFLFGSVRFVVGGTLLFLVSRVIAVRRGAAPLPVVDAADRRHLLVVAFCTVLVSNGFNVWGIRHVASNEAALLNVASTFLITFLGTFGRRAHPVSGTVLVGLLLGVVGLVLVIDPFAAARAGSAAGATTHLLAELAILTGCLGWAAGTIHQRNARMGIDLMGFTGLQMLLGGLMMAVPALLAGDFARWSWDPAGLAALAWMTIMSSCIAYTAYAWLSVHATPAQTGSFGLAVPALAALLGWWVLGERLTALQTLGMAVILAGVLLVNLPRATGSAPPAAPRADA